MATRGHVVREALDVGVSRDVQIANHGVGFPTTYELDGVVVDIEWWRLLPGEIWRPYHGVVCPACRVPRKGVWLV